MARSAKPDPIRREDAAARIRAQTVFDRPYVLVAGAGTGKTTALVARVVAWCLGPGWEHAAGKEAGRGTSATGGNGGLNGDSGADLLRERIAARVLDGVAAITFTDAAAAEMAARAGAALALLAGNELPKGVEEGALGCAGEERRLRAVALLGHLDRLSIRTIHAYCRRLLAAFPLEAGLHPGFEVDADGQMLAGTVREAVAEALRQGYGDPGDADLLDLARGEIGPPQIELAAAALAASGVEPQALEVDPFTPEWFEASRDALSEALTAFLAVGGGRGQGKSMTAVSVRLIEAARHTAKKVAELPGDDSAAQSALCASADELLDGHRGRLGEWATGDFNKTDSGLLDDVQPELESRAAELQRRLAELSRVDPVVVGQLRRVLAPILRRTQERMRARGVETFADLLHHTRRLLATRPDVRARIRAGMTQLLVDEFQDTDAIQCDIVRWLALDGPAEERPSLFLVGDPKQSIYSFRNADLAAYDDFLLEVEAAGGEIGRLSVNHRSVPAILDEVERIVRPIMIREKGLQPEFQPLIASARNESRSGYTTGGRAAVEHWISWGRDADTGAPKPNTNRAEATKIEAHAVALDIRELHEQGVPWQSVGILLRSRGDLETYLAALRERGVPYAVGKDKSYYRRREIVEATTVVAAVLDPNDHLALLAWLRSPTVGVPDAALFGLWARDLPRLATELAGPDEEQLKHIEKLVLEVVAELPKDIPGIERIAGWERCLIAAMRALGELRGLWSSAPPDTFVARLRSLTLIEATEASRWLGHYRIANLDRFFRELTASLAAPGADLLHILRDLRTGVDEQRDADEARPREALAHAVRVMTIHEAKGLDFGHVYLVQVHKGSQGGRDTTLGQDEGQWQWEMFKSRTPGFHRILDRRARNEAAERVRALYVALTRAEDRLVVVGCWEGAATLADPASVAKAACFADLLNSRQPAAPPLLELASRVTESSTGAPAEIAEFTDESAVRWLFPGLGQPATTSTAGMPHATTAERATNGAAGAPPAPSEGDAAREIAELTRHRAEAARRMARPWSAPASAAAHEALREMVEAKTAGADLTGERPAPWPAGAGGGARAIGTVIHRVLETWDLSARPAAELTRQRNLLSTLLRPLLPPDEFARALSRAGALLDKMARGICLARLLELGQNVIARELPLLLLPQCAGSSADRNNTDASGPVGYVAGAVDLVYRDPKTGEIVVADYKTDDVTDAALAERVAAYTLQGAVYVQGVQQALGLPKPPRFELWFLAADRIERS